MQCGLLAGTTLNGNVQASRVVSQDRLNVEQNLEVYMAVADRLQIIDGGTVIWEGDAAALAKADEVRGRCLTLEHA
jgi:ABC-type branched-subunit amino acid transport system ATPase component